MCKKTKWLGLWKQRDAVYSGQTIKREEIPEHAKLIIRYNKFYDKNSNAPRFVYCFATGNAAKAITTDLREIFAEDCYEFEDTEIEENYYVSLFEAIEKDKEEVLKLLKVIKGGGRLYTHEEVQYAINRATEDAQSGYTDNIVSDYL